MRLPHLTPRAPRRTLRLRLTLLYGGLFLASGAALLAVTYVLVVRNTSGFIFKSENGANGAVVTAAGGAPHDRPRPAARHLRTRPGDDRTARQLDAQARRLEAQARRQHASVLHQLLVQSGIALAAMAVLSIGLGWIVAGRVLRPLRTITAAARDISATNLHERLALDGPEDELRELGDTFDGLLARLEASFAAQRRFVANASHELRTPLARQRTLAQVALADPDATVESLRSAHERVLASGAQQERLIEALLTLTRGQAGVAAREPFDLAEVTARVVAERQADGVELNTALARAPAAPGDARLVERLVANLVDNALRHNVSGGRVDIVTATRPGRAVLSVTNTGPEVPAAAVERLFEPFQRADRSARGNGVGLGLSIVKAIAEAHGATVAAAPRPGGGLRVEVAFPAQAAEPEAAQTAEPRPPSPAAMSRDPQAASS